MKLCVWREPYHVSWGGSFVVVAANSVEEAKQMFLKEHPNRIWWIWGKGEVPELADPSEILDLPAITTYEWQE